MALPVALRGGRAGRRVPSEVFQPVIRSRIARDLIPTFAETGYQAATIRGLAGLAGISIGRFYEMYGGKQACFEGVLDYVLEEGEAAVVTAIEPAASWPRKVEQAMQAILAAAETHRDAARLVLVEAQRAGSAGVGRYRGLIDRLTSLLGEGRELLPASAEPSRCREFAMVNGIGAALACRLVEGKPLRDPALLDDLTSLLLEPYRALAASA